MKYVKRTGQTVFIIGLLVLCILSIIGVVYLTKMAYNDKRLEDGSYCGATETERNIARITVVAIWIMFAWIIIGTTLKEVWKDTC